MARQMNRSKRNSLLLLVFLAVVVNLPLLHSTWTDSRVQADGVDVTATVTDGSTQDGSWVTFRFPEDIDPDQQSWHAEVDQETYDEAQRTGELQVRVLEDDPAAFRVDGQVESSIVLVFTLVADLILLLVFVLLWRSSGRLRGQLQAIALQDVERGDADVLLERLQGEEYLISGDVLELEPGRVVLDLGNRSVVVLLDGHANPVGYQQSARVRARLL
ncbi:hypothetical protein [Nocardioides sp. SR21]|uniref:hypothetical protein n=1 Tax=Nocardioides sp. SR21 TaxID=2919501 RepID=UPI001FAAC5DC|nr:hypothetical protein [Nocardioides sp. SR21]